MSNRENPAPACAGCDARGGYVPDCVIFIAQSADTKRYHTVIMTRSPAPSEDDETCLRRYRSRAHHAAGFESLEDAIAERDAQARGRDADISTTILVFESAIDDTFRLTLMLPRRWHDPVS